MIYRFRYWTEWCDDKGRMWAEPHDYDSSVEARKAHTSSLAFMWAHNMQSPSVSDLYSIAVTEDPDTGKKREQNRTSIQDGARREFHAATLP
jgi:hypothetical protein